MKIDLKILKERSRTMGHYRACLSMGLPELKEDEVKDSALNYFHSLPASLSEEYFLEKVWLSAFSDVGHRLGLSITF